jgi:hypothetical protein
MALDAKQFAAGIGALDLRPESLYRPPRLNLSEVAAKDVEEIRTNAATAQKLIALAISTDKTIGAMFEEVENISDDQERTHYKRAIGDIMGYISRDLIFPIVDQHPQLDPDK